ncbi:alanine racemase [Microbacterium sp.]|uniref:alanine racemase n=1 Tax=Microbacterium sp. TaxID=51671 RepID=UPI002736147B|nr:alanine racemase [Microbacterium sp.]MDP3952774.1 alanine racemase [Microbacterium sp.]
MNELAEIRLMARHKGIPERAVGMTTAEFLASGPRLSEFWTPLVVLDDAAMRHNVETMATWCAERGLELMPHGKTTMAPALWQRQLDAGSLGITLATMGQVRTARTFGVSSIMLANAAVDGRSLRYLAGELADTEFRFVCWADSIATVEAMEAPLRGAPRKLDVLVELGGEGGRTGARTIDEAIAIAERIAASDVLRLAGVAGYEGSLAHDRSVQAIYAVETYLRRQIELHERIGHLYDDGDVYVTAGGSAYFDLVAQVYAEAGASANAAERPGGGRTLFTLRSGAYIVHDDGFYRGISPFDEGRASDDEPRFIPGMFGVGRVVSHPEPGLALIDGGKRDFPFDEGLPIPRAMSAQLGAAWQPLPAASVSAMNDQHTYVRGGDLAIGDLVRLGLSHPCTAFDKWTVLPVVESVDSDVVVDLIHTFF